jgi:hypothetical protein
MTSGAEDLLFAAGIATPHLHSGRQPAFLLAIWKPVSSLWTMRSALIARVSK